MKIFLFSILFFSFEIYGSTQVLKSKKDIETFLTVHHNVRRFLLTNKLVNNYSRFEVNKIECKFTLKKSAACPTCKEGDYKITLDINLGSNPKKVTAEFRIGVPNNYCDPKFLTKELDGKFSFN